MNSILPPSASKNEQQLALNLIKRLDKVNEGISQIDIYPLTAPKVVLPVLAKMHSIDISAFNLNNSQDESEVRKLLSNMFMINYYDGTVWAMEKILESVFDNYKIIEGPTPYTFSVQVQAPTVRPYVLSEEKIKNVKKLITRTKNVRSHFNKFMIQIPPVIEKVLIKSSVYMQVKMNFISKKS